MKKVLFICGMFYPNYSANGICCKNVMDELKKNNYEIFCIANDYYGCNKQSEVDGIKLYRVKKRLILRLQEYADRKNMKHMKKILYFFNKCKLFVMSPLWPLVSPLYTLRMYNQAKKIHKKEKIDIVVSAYSPIDSLLAGYKLKKKYKGIKFIPYYLDALAGGWGPKVWSVEKIDKITRRLEEKIDMRADLIVSMESSRKYHLENPIKNFNLKRQFLDVPTLLKRDISKHNKNITHPGYYGLYAGNLSSCNRNYKYLLKIFEKICLNNDVYINFVGDCSDVAVFEKYEKITNGRIKYLGKKSRKEVEKMEISADFFLNFGSSNPYTVPCKIFEYMSFKKPIISTYIIDNEPSIIYLKKYKDYFLVNENDKIDDSLIDNISNFIQKDRKIKENVDIYDTFYTNTPKAFVNLVNQIYGGSNE